jgi:hypothetical protein
MHSTMNQQEQQISEEMYRQLARSGHRDDKVQQAAKRRFREAFPHMCFKGGNPKKPLVGEKELLTTNTAGHD